MERICKAQNCDRTDIKSHGYCNLHWQRIKRNGSTEPKMLKNGPRSRYPEEYKSWEGALQRCYTKTNNAYPNYGGRGIKVCERWTEKPYGFSNFIKDMGPKPSYERTATGGKPLYSLDRIDPNGDYCPENCRWADRKTQTVNRRGTVRIEYNNQIHTIEEWSQITGIAAGTLRTRLYTRKWSVEKSLTTPISEANTIRDLEQAKGRVCCRFWIASDIAEKIKCLGENDVDKTSEVVESALRAYLSRK